MKKITLLSGFLFLISSTLLAQTLPFKTYPIKEGLAQSIVYSIFQDSKGYLWFGTQYGVSKFDGINFSNYTTEQGLVHNRVISIT